MCTWLDNSRDWGWRWIIVFKRNNFKFLRKKQKSNLGKNLSHLFNSKMRVCLDDLLISADVFLFGSASGESAVFLAIVKEFMQLATPPDLLLVVISFKFRHEED